MQVTPVESRKLAQLREGLKKLNQADPSVRVWVQQQTGNYILGTAGEVHLSRCITDLTQRYARMEITVSDPIVAFRETVVVPPKTDQANEAIEDAKDQV